MPKNGKKGLCKYKHGGETGIRTLGSTKLQRFSRPSRSTTPASLHGQTARNYKLSICFTLALFPAFSSLRHRFFTTTNSHKPISSILPFTAELAASCPSWKHPDSACRCVDSLHVCCSCNASCRRADIPSVRCRDGNARHTPTPRAGL